MEDKMKRKILFLLLLLLIGFSGCVKYDNDSFNSYLDEVFIEIIGEDPQTINSILLYPENHDLNSLVVSRNIDESSFNKYISRLKKIKKKLDNFNNELLSEKDILTKKILIDYLNREINYEGLYYYDSQLGVYQRYLPLTLSEYRFDDLNDIENYFDYLKTSKSIFKSMIDFEKKKINLGIGLPKDLINRIIEEVERYIDSEETFLNDSFIEKTNKLNLEFDIKSALVKENSRLVDNELMDAYHYLLDELIKLEKIANSNVIISTKSRMFYEAEFKKNTGTNFSMEEVIQYLDNLIDNLKVQRISYGNDYELVYSNYDLIEDKSFEEILPFFEKVMIEDFPKLNMTINYKIKDIHESIKEHSAPAMYFVSPVDSNVEEVIYINPINFKQTNNYVYQTLAHEGFPGHLYQNVYLKNSDHHIIRKILDYPGYVEGWATYVENFVIKYAGGNEYVREIFSFETSFPYLILGRFDIGINYQGWTITEAKKYLERYFDSKSLDIEELYFDMIESKTNFLMYFFSYYQIVDLKQKFKAIAKEDYSDYLFHKIYLETGPSSFPILESQYINYRKYLQ